MELREALSPVRLVIVVVVTAVIAALVGAWFVSNSESELETSGVVSLGEFVAVDTVQGTNAAIDGFESALASDRVSELVAVAAPSAIGGVEATSLGGSGDVRVTLVSTNAQQAEAALDAASREALSILLDTERRQVERSLAAAEAEAGSSTEQLLVIEAEAGTADLAAEAARRSGDLLALRNQIAASEGDVLVQAALEATLAEKQEELAAIEVRLLGWTDVRARYDLAVDAAAGASLRLRQISTAQADLQDEALLQSVSTTESSVLSDLVRVVVGVAIVVGAVLLVGTLLIGRLGPPARRDGDVTDPEKMSAFPTNDEPDPLFDEEDYELVGDQLNQPPEPTGRRKGA